VTCVVAGLAFFFAARPATAKFPYGFGRSEYIAGLLVAVTVVLVGINFVYASASRLLMPVPVWFSWSFFGIIAGTAAVKLCMALYFGYVNKKIDSDAVKAMMLDSYIDTAVTVMALFGFLLAGYSGLTFDAVFGIVTGVIIIVSGVKLVIHNTAALIGKGASEEDKAVAEAACAEVGAKLISLEVHSYGKTKRFGIIKIYYENKTAVETETANRVLGQKIKEKSAIDIIIATEGSYGSTY
jgi:cation diffusion facilitator family transporter